MVSMKKNFKGYARNIITYISVFAVLAVSVLSVFTGIDFGVTAAGAGSRPDYVWGGAQGVTAGKVTYAGGTGTAQDPYLISNGDQLYKMVHESGRLNAGTGAAAYFKLTNDIYLNDVSANNWYEGTNLNDWYYDTSLFDKIFAGTLDGGNFTIYGLYFAQNGAATIYRGLVARANDATFKNINFRKAYMSGCNWSQALLVGRAERITVERVSAVDFYSASGNRDGGIVASAPGAASFKDCFVADYKDVTNANNDYGILAARSAQNTISLENCVSLGCQIVSFESNAVVNNVDEYKKWESYSFKNVYSDTVYTQSGKPYWGDWEYAWSDAEITYAPNAVKGDGAVVDMDIDAADVKGDAAKTTLAGFDFNNVWKTTNGYPEFRNTDIWDGDTATTIDMFSGEGTQGSPYLIYNANQLYAAIKLGGLKGETPAYFKVMNDIYLNDVKSGTIADIAVSDRNNWLSDSSLASVEFKGILDGNHNTIFGLYAANNGNAALIPTAASGAEVLNLTVSDSAISGATVGGIIASGSATVTGCALTESTVNATTIGGAILGSGTITATACYSHSNTATGTFGGIVGNASGTLSDCYSVGFYPIASGAATATTVFTDTDGAVSGITKKNTADMKGVNALSNMAFTDVTNFQATISYPIARIKVADPDAHKVWDGTNNDSWLSTGDGSKDDPYEISTAAQFENLRQKFAGTQTFAGKYFVLTDDIYFNSVVYDDWYTNSPREWWGWSSNNNKGFAGNFDGQGHTIYGLYTAVGPQTGGLFPVLLSGATVKNLSFESAYLAGNNRGGSDDALRGAVAGVINGAVNISNVYVGTDVILSAEKAGGIAGWVIQNNPATVIENCAFVGSLINDPSGAAPVSAAGFVGATWSDNTDNLTILGSFTTANIAAGQVKSGRNVYSSDKPTYQLGATNANGSSLISVGSIGKMMGKAAVTNMPALAWGDIWNMSQVSFPTLNRSGYSVWVGTEISTGYAGGDGSEANPYIIENANQLYKMVKAKGKNDIGKPATFKIKDGVTAIYLNAVAGMTADEAKEYLMTSGNQWLYYGHDAAGSTEGFVGKFDGNGCTIYGLYQHGTARSHDIGLIPTLGNGAYIANLNVTNSVVISDDTQHHAAVISERVIGNTGATIKNVGVTDSYVKAQWAGGFVGSNCGRPLTAQNCLSVNNTIEIKENPNETNECAGGMFGDIYASTPGIVRVIDCLCVGSYPTDNIAYNGASTAYYFEDVYTDVDVTAYEDYDKLTDTKKEQLANIKLLTSAQINGDAAKTSMAFDFDKQWSATAEYPVPQVRDIDNGIVGGIWSGNTAEYFMSGDGTETNPFVIDTPERLYKALNDNISSVYYLITEDIYLNDITNDVSLWNSEWDVDSVFTANISGYDGSLGAKGGNHTVYGLYKKAASGEIAALIPELGSNVSIKNIKLAAAHLEGESGSIVGGIAGYVSSKTSNVSVAACEIEDSVSLMGGSTTGGIIAKIEGSAVIYDCAFKSKLDNPLGINGAIVGESTGAASVFNSYALGTHIAGRIQTTSGVYSNVSQSTSQAAKDVNFIRLPNDHFIGANAQTYMTEFDFVATWAIVDGGYPVIIGEAQPFNGTVGGIWSGLSATDYAGGTGTAGDPYLIATGEQLYKCVTTPTADTVGKHYKLVADILLNNVYVENQVYSEQWAQKTNLNSWVSQTGTHFRGHFDGDGHIVSGIYYADQEKLDTGYVALFPAVHEGAVIENVGVTDMYVDSPFTGNIYAAAIVGCVPLYDTDFKLAQQQVTATKTAGDVLNEMYDKDSIDEYKAKGVNVPIVRNCFGDDTVSISAYTVGGIVCGSGFMIDVSNCYFTGSLACPSEHNIGAIIGNAWIHGSRTTNCFGFSQELTYFNGNMFRSVNFDNTKEFIGDCYGLSRYEQQGVTTVIYGDWQGEAAKKNLSKLDFENVWQTVEGGTPVLKVFLKHGNRKAEDISFMGPINTTLSFSGEGIYGIDPITAPIKSPVELPVPERYGYEFVQWHVFQELGWPYDYGYMPYRNLTLFPEWKSLTISQTFEGYTNTEYDMGSDWQNFRPGVKGFNTDFVHGGAKSMRRIGEVQGEQDMLINYKTPLEVGVEYNMSFWVCTPKDNAKTKVSLVRNTWPDIAEPITGVETMLVTKNTVSGKWTKYTYKFTADTQWVSFRTDGNAEIFFDDITFVPVGGKALSGGTSTSPATGDNAIPYLAVVSAFAAGAVMMFISRKNMIEVIEK